MLAAGAVAALAAGAPAAQAAPEVKTLPCVPYVENQATQPSTVAGTMPITASGFTPGQQLTLYTTSGAAPAPRLLGGGPLDGLGIFQTTASPPSFSRANDTIEAFNLIAEDRTNPVAPLVAVTPFQLVRFGLTIAPTPKYPRSRVTFTARGFLPGKPIYVHFRYRGATRRTVRLGIAEGPCGIASRRMRALPTKLRFGSWRMAVDQSPRYSTETLPQWLDGYNICRGACR